MAFADGTRQCSMSSYRLWLYGCNIVLICAVLIFVAATWITANEDRMMLISLDKWETLVLFIYISAMMQILDVFFCFVGLWRNMVILMYVYWTCLLLITVLDFVLGVLWVFRWQQLHNVTSTFALTLITSQYNDTGLCRVWDDLQTEFDCCGVVSYRDWLTVPQWCSQDLGNDTLLPRSCCHNEFSYCNASVFALLDDDEQDDPSAPSRMVPGCRNSLLLWMHNKGGNLFLIGFCFVILLKIIFLIILKTEIREFTYEVDAVSHKVTMVRLFSVDHSPFTSLLNQSAESVLASPRRLSSTKKSESFA